MVTPGTHTALLLLYWDLCSASTGFTLNDYFDVVVVVVVVVV